MSTAGRRAMEVGAFVVFLGGVHFAYYKIQNNDALVPKESRQELFYVAWLKEKIPALKGWGVHKD